MPIMWKMVYKNHEGCSLQLGALGLTSFDFILPTNNFNKPIQIPFFHCTFMYRQDFPNQIIYKTPTVEINLKMTQGM